MGLPKSDKEWYAYYQSRGLIAPENEGFVTETLQGAGKAVLDVGSGLGSTVEEMGGGSGMRDYFEGAKAVRRNWEPDENYSAMSLNPGNLGRTIGSGVAQSGLALGAGVAGTALSGGNPAAGIAAAAGVTFAQIYGDTVKEYREALPNESESTVKGLAFMSASGQSLLESILGPERMAAGITRQFVTKSLKETTQHWSKELGKEGAKQFISEGSEEVAQDFWNRLTLAVGKKDGIELPSWNEVGEQFFGGAIPGAVLGGAGGVARRIGANREVSLRDGQESSPVESNPPASGKPFIPELPQETIDKIAPQANTESTVKPESSVSSPESPENLNSQEINPEPEVEKRRKAVNLALVDSVAQELGLKVNYFDEAAKDGEIANGHYDPKSGAIHINRNDAAKDPMQSLGHEFKHYLDQNHGDLSKQFNELFDKGLNEEGQAAIAETQELYGSRGDGKEEVNADTFAQFWSDPEFWKDVTAKAEAKQAGMGKKFVQALDEFIKMVRGKLKEIGTPEAKELFDNLGELRASAIEALAEYKRRTGTSSNAENVVGVQGGHTVQSVKVSDLNIDPVRFQFKSKADKKTGVDESNKLGGEYDPKTAGNLYVWESKSGKKYVVNGHHRFQLAQNSNVDSVNAIVDREADGITSAQAKKNGTLINIRDEQGDVSDYAAFVRSDKMDEKTAEKEGVLAREKGRLGYQIGHYASDNLYSTYKSGDLTDRQTAMIADISRGDEGLEAAGIRAAKTMSVAQLKEFLRLLKDSPRQQEKAEGDLFGFDDSAIKTAEALSKLATQHIKEINEKVRVARQAVNNPEVARKMGISVKKEADKLLKDALRTQNEWENWTTNKELYNRLLAEAGLKKEEAEVKPTPTVKEELTVQPEPAVAKNATGEAEPQNAENIYLRMPIDRVRKDAESGVVLAKEALKVMDMKDVSSEIPPKPEVVEKISQPESVEDIPKDIPVESDFSEKQKTAEITSEVNSNRSEVYLSSVGKTARASRYEKTEPYYKRIEDGLKVLPDSIAVKPLGNVAYHAYSNISHTPEERAIAVESDYIGEIANLYEELQEAGVKDIDAEVSRYAEQLHGKYSAWLGAKSRTMSSFITGPANFPVARNEKAQRVEQNRLEELSEWRKKAKAAIKKQFGIREPGYKEVISSDDPDAIDKLKVKLETEKRNHARSLEGNKILRNKKMSGVEKTAALKELGFTKLDLDWAIEQGSSFSTINSNAEIKRLEGRIAELEAKKTKQTVEQDFPGGKLIQNMEANRIQFIFDSKPDAETMQKLKSHGFKWAPSQSAWQRQLTPNAIYTTKQILRELKSDEVKHSISPAPNENIFYNETVRKESEDFKQELDQFLKDLESGNASYGKGIKVTSCPEILKRLGENDKPVYITGDVIHKILRPPSEKKQGHYIPVAVLEKIATELHDPIMICNSMTDSTGNTLVFILELKHDNENLMVPLKMDRQTNRINIHIISSLYGKPKSVYKDMVETGLVYYDSKRASNVFPNSRASIALRGRRIKSSGRIILEKNDFVNNGNEKHSISRPQVNPIREDGAEKKEYQQKLDNRELETRSGTEVNDEAAKRIANMGGVGNLLQSVLDVDFQFNSDTAQRMAQIALNSEEYKALSPEDRAKIADAYIDAGTKAGRELASRRLAILDMSNIQSIQAQVNALVSKIEKEKPLKDLQKEIKNKLGIDIENIPEELVNNPAKLDELLRTLIAQNANGWDKAYEWWINSILSSPTTHIANTIGNTANAVYELSFKRFAEALINVVAKKKDAATFGEFKEMSKAFDWGTAFRNAKRSFDLEAITSAGKIETQVRTAIGGRLGRAVRVPGRFLRAADEFAKSIINPVEATAFAYREGMAAGLKGDRLNKYIQEQVSKPNSKARQYGEEQGLNLTFQEEPGAWVEKLMALREAGGVTGTVLKYMLPFLKTPTNLVRQGVRKSPLGVLNLAVETADILRGKRQFDNEYIQHAAEQLLAWGAVAAFMSMDDDDEDMPFLTGSSAKYGSAEQKFKANKMPPFSIRIGDNYYSYKRIEPLATGLAFIADGMESYKMAKNGEDGTKIMKKLIGGVQQLIVEKSYLDSLGEIYKVANDPERSFAQSTTGFLSSWMPNVIRSTIAIYDDNVSDNKSRSKGAEFWEDQFWITTNRMGITKASPKLDYFGREIKKDSLADAGALWPLARMVPIQSVKPDDNMDKAEQLIWNYNQTADTAWYPDVPAYYFERGGKKYYFAREDYQDYARESGELAHKQIMAQIKAGTLSVNNPSEKDIEAIKKTFARARKQVKEKMFQQRRYSE